MTKSLLKPIKVCIDRWMSQWINGWMDVFTLPTINVCLLSQQVKVKISVVLSGAGSHYV